MGPATAILTPSRLSIARLKGCTRLKDVSATAGAVVTRRIMQAIGSTISQSVLLISRPPLSPFPIGFEDAKLSRLDARRLSDASRAASVV